MVETCQPETSGESCSVAHNNTYGVATRFTSFPSLNSLTDIPTVVAIDATKALLSHMPTRERVTAASSTDCSLRHVCGDFRLLANIAGGVNPPGMSVN
jgi:hypothetical protein